VEGSPQDMVRGDVGMLEHVGVVGEDDHDGVGCKR
jgi:hypothetical protein